MNQQFSFPGRKNRCGGGCDRAPYRSRMGRSTVSGGGCGLGGRLPTNRDMNPRTDMGMSRAGCPCQSASVTQSNSCGCGSTGINQENGAVKSCGCARSRTSGGCSCGGEASTASATCRKLMDQIRAVDFALYEVVLYLDVYPHSCDALETYHKLKTQREELHRAYEATVGPLTAFGNESTTSWDWMKKPFPWEYDAE